MFSINKNLTSKFIEITELISIRNSYAKKKNINIPLPVFFIHSIKSVISQYPETFGIVNFKYNNIPELLLYIEDKGILEESDSSNILNINSWYEENKLKEKKISFFENLKAIFNPSKLIRKTGTVSVYFPGKNGLDIFFKKNITAMTFSIGTIYPLWSDFDENEEVRKWGVWFSLSYPDIFNIKLVGKIIAEISQKLHDPNLQEFNLE